MCVNCRKMTSNWEAILHSEIEIKKKKNVCIFYISNEGE